MPNGHIFRLAWRHNAKCLTNLSNLDSYLPGCSKDMVRDATQSKSCFAVGKVILRHVSDAPTFHQKHVQIHLRLKISRSVSVNFGYCF